VRAGMVAWERGRRPNLLCTLELMKKRWLRMAVRSKRTALILGLSQGFSRFFDNDRPGFRHKLGSAGAPALTAVFCLVDKNRPLLKIAHHQTPWRPETCRLSSWRVRRSVRGR